MKIISCNVLAAALATALLSPAAIAQSGNSATTAQAQEVPRAPLPPPVTPRLPVNQDPRTPPTGTETVQVDEAPMTSTRPAPPPQAQSHSKASDQSAVAMQDQWTTLDADRDGRISTAEAAVNTSFKRDFSMIDTNDDGFVSPDEHRAHVRQMAGHHGTPTSQGQGAEHAAPHSAVVQRELWSELDTDGDGRISSVESSLDSQFGARFRNIDANGDGYVDSGEYRTYSQREQMSFTGDANVDEEPVMDEDDLDETEAERIEGDGGNEPVDDERDGG